MHCAPRAMTCVIGVIPASGVMKHCRMGQNFSGRYIFRQNTVSQDKRKKQHSFFMRIGMQRAVRLGEINLFFQKARPVRFGN